MNRSTLLKHGVAVALVMSTLAQTAQTAEDRAADPLIAGLDRILDEVQVTATRRQQSTFDVPAATTVADAQHIRAAAAQTAMDLLHGQAGTFVQQTTPGQAIVIVRGLKGSEVLHLVDGLRLNNAIFRNSPNQYMALVDGQALDRIEVVRGPASALYGGDAMGGVLQMFTREPRFEGSGWQFQQRLRSQYASADRSLASRAEAALGTQGLAFSGGVTFQDVGELRTGDGGRRAFTAYTARAADLKANIDLAEDHELMLQGQWLEQPSTPRVDELVPGYDQSQPNSVEFAFEPQARRFGHVRYRHRGAGGLWDELELHAGRQVIIDDRRSRETGTVNREIEQNSSTLDALTLQASRQLGDHFLTYGAEYYSDTIRSKRRRENIDTGAITERTPRFPDRSTMDQLGLFIADSWSAGRLDLNSGVRYSLIETRLTPLGGFIVEVSDADVSASLGAGYSLSPQWKLVANAGRAFRPPNVFDLGTFGDRPGNRFNIPNPALRPERVVTFDAGVKHAGKRWSASAFAFVSRYEDKITPVLTGETLSSGRLVVQSRNATRLDLRGVEVELRATLTETVTAQATATYTYGDERLDGDQYPADRIPPLYGRAGASWQMTERLAVEAYAYYATRQDRLSPRDEIDPRIDPQGTGGWITWNTRLAFSAGDRFDISLRLENLGDRSYREHGSGLDEAGFDAILTADWRL